MKKIFGIIVLSVVVLGNINIVFGAESAACQECKSNADGVFETCKQNFGENHTGCINDHTTSITACEEGICSTDEHGCKTDTEERDTAAQKCVPKTAPSSNPTTTLPAECNIVNGITICEDCLTNGQCKFNIYDTLGIRKSVRATGDATSVGLFVQDIVLSATFFIGTVVTVALIVSGIMYIFAAASGKDPGTAKKGIIGALIGLVIVASSYFIIRLVQYLAKGI